MNKRRLAAALAAVLIIGCGSWLMTRENASNGAARNPAKSALDATHEKAFLREQLRLNPTHGPILLRLAQIERGEGDLRGARDHLEQAVAADGRQVEARLELGLVCGEMGDLAAAEAQNRAVLGIEPGQVDALYNLGAMAANRGDVQRARGFWADAVRAAPKSEGAEKARRAMEKLQAAMAR